MDDAAVDRAAALLAQAWRGRDRIGRLPEDCRPAGLADALRIQQRIAEQLGEPVVGWKVGSPMAEGVPRGGVLRSRLLRSGSRIAAADVPLLGMEAEIAFRFLRAAPPREAPYTDDEVADLVEPFVALEIVASRYLDYAGTPLVERIADFMSNGALVAGDPVPAWRTLDLAGLTAELWFDDHRVVRQTAGHTAGHPLRPAVQLVNDLRRGSGVSAGALMTTGTFTGLTFAQPGMTVRAVFEGVGSADIRIAP